MRHATDDEAPQELALVPYLDILMNLIVFVLLSLPGLAALGIVEGRAAGRCADCDGSPAVATASLDVHGCTVSVGARRERVDFGADASPLTEVLQQLQAGSLVLRVAPDVELQRTISAMDAAHAARLEVVLSD